MRKGITIGAAALATALLAIAGCGHGQCARAADAEVQRPPASAPRPMLDGLFAQGRLTRPLEQLIASAALTEGEAFKIIELGRDATSSHHIVTLRDREPVHRHDLHDLLVFVLQGHGHMLIGGEERAIGAHSIVYVPRGTPHAMRAGTGSGPIAGYAVFTPAFDGDDRVLVEPTQGGEPKP